MQKDILKYAGLNGAGTALYIFLIVTVLTNAENWFPKGPDPKTVLLPMTMLMLFVLSAAITSGLVLGRPLLWYLDGKKKEAVTLFIYTLCVLFVIMLVVFFTLLSKYGL